MISNFDQQTIASGFESYWVPHIYNLVLHESKAKQS